MAFPLSSPDLRHLPWNTSKANDWQRSNPSGALFLNSDSSIVESNVITGNSGLRGGGFFLSNSHAQIRNNQRVQNMASDGAGIFAQESSDALLSHNLIKENHATSAESEAGELTQSETLSMFEGRGQVFGDLDGLQTESKGSDEAKRQEIGQAINQIYQTTKTDVQAILDNLESLVDSAFNQGATKAQQAATAYIKTETQAYKDARYKTDETIDTSGGFMDTLGSVVEAGSETLSGGVKWIGDTLVGMPDEYYEIYNVGRDKYIAEMDDVLGDVATLVGEELGHAKKRITQGRQEIEEYVAKQPDDLKQISLDAAQNIQGEFDTLEETVDSKADSLVNSLAEKYNENLAELDSQLDTLKEADKGLLQNATDNLSGVIQTISSLREMLMGVLNSAAEVVTTIIADPIGFLSNLIDGVGQGLQNFVGNIGPHLQTGLATWLFGEVAKAGIQMPETLDMKGLLELGTQVLGLTWDFIRNRAAKRLGDDVVSQLEESFDLFLIIKEQGMGGLWEQIQDQIGDLKETIIGSIGEMVAGVGHHFAQVASRRGAFSTYRGFLTLCVRNLAPRDQSLRQSTDARKDDQRLLC